jgi:hypothetical protein
MTKFKTQISIITYAIVCSFLLFDLLPTGFQRITTADETSSAMRKLLLSKKPDVKTKITPGEPLGTDGYRNCKGNRTKKPAKHDP